MKLPTKSPKSSNCNLNKEYFSNYKSKSPYIASNLSFKNNEIINVSCNCSCHRHNINHYNKYNKEYSYNNLSPNNLRKEEIISISDDNMPNENRNILKNKSVNNLITNPNNNYYLFSEPKKNYVPNYNYNTQKKSINNHSHKNIIFTSENAFNNHSFIDIKQKSNKEEKENKMYKVKLPRKQLSKFYHFMGLKRYPYNKGTVKTTNNTDNHKYTEIFDVSGENKDNYNNIKVNNINTNNKLNNHQISGSQCLSRNRNSNNFLEEQKDSEVQSRILKETSNTRLLEVKSPSKEKKIFGRNIYLNDNRKNLFKSYNYNRGNEYNTDNNYKYKVIRYDKNTDIINNNNNKYNNKPELNINNIYDSNAAHIFSQNKNFSKKTHIPYSILTRNTNYEQNYKCNSNINPDNNLKKENNLNKKLCMLKNNRINNINYNILKQKVRLSLLKKQMYEQKRDLLFNNVNQKNKGNKYNCGNTLYEKTRKLMDNNNCLEEINNVNNNNYLEENRYNTDIKSNIPGN